jgi:hypothetical protein
MVPVAASLVQLTSQHQEAHVNYDAQERPRTPVPRMDACPSNSFRPLTSPSRSCQVERCQPEVDFIAVFFLSSSNANSTQLNAFLRLLMPHRGLAGIMPIVQAETANDLQRNQNAARWMLVFSIRCDFGGAVAQRSQRVVA